MTKREVAIQRANLLWEQYTKTEGKLLLKDVRELTQTQYNQLYQSFKHHEIAAPPVYDSQKEKLRRKADNLWEGGKERLTGKEAGRILGVSRSRVIGVITQIKKSGFEIPEIVNTKAEVKADENEYDGIFRVHGNVNSAARYYPHYLQAIECWDGPGENETTYRLY